MKVDEKFISYIPFNVAATPKDGVVLTDRWWIVDPEHGLLVWRDIHYQCNHSKSMAESIKDNLYPELEVRHFDVVFTGRFSSCA